MYKILSIILFLIISFSTTAQKITVSGTVYDGSKPYEGVSLWVKNSNFATEKLATDKTGRYSLICEIGDTINVRYPNTINVDFPLEEWIVDKQNKDFIVGEYYDYDYISKSWADYIVVSATYSPADQTMRTSFGFTSSFFNYKFCDEKSWKPINRLTNRLGGNLTFAKPNWNKNGLLYSQILLNQNLMYIRESKLNFFAFGGVGYYWNVNDNAKIRKGNMMFSTGIQFYSKNIKNVSFKISGGYNWFSGRSESNHIFLSVSVSPFTRKIRRQTNSSLQRNCKKILDTGALIDL